MLESNQSLPLLILYLVNQTFINPPHSTNFLLARSVWFCLILTHQGRVMHIDICKLSHYWLVQIMVCRPFATSPLSEPMLTRWPLHPKEHISSKFHFHTRCTILVHHSHLDASFNFVFQLSVKCLVPLEFENLNPTPARPSPSLERLTEPLSALPSKCWKLSNR